MNISLDMVLAISPLCACENKAETTEQFLLRCHFYNTQRLGLFENTEKVHPNFLSLSAKNQLFILFYGSAIP